MRQRWLREHEMVEDPMATDDQVRAPGPALVTADPTTVRPSRVLGPSAARHRKRRRRRSRAQRILAFPRHHPIVLAIAVITLLAVEWGAYRLYLSYQAYQDVRQDVRVLRSFSSRDAQSLSTGDLRQIEDAFGALDRDLARLDSATSLPVGSGLVARVPWAGQRYAEGRELIALGRLVAPLGRQSAAIGSETLAAYDTAGVSAGDAPSGPTWLDVLTAHEGDIQHVVAGVTQVRELRATIDAELLPAAGQRSLAELDRVLARGDEQQVPETLALLKSAFGAERPVRYLVLFPNPAEMRPAGGFPGDIALVEIERGQLRSYEFFGISPLAEDYNARRSSKVALPWPYEQYFRTDGLQIQDAVWEPDFAKFGRQFMAMYAQSGWPPIDGVVAAQSAVASDLLQIVGPALMIDVDGDTREITPDNLYDEIERQRRLRMEDGVPRETSHKVVLATIGAEIIERLKTADRDQLRTAAEALRAAAERRDLQFFAADPALEAWLDERRWTGRMTTEPARPTLAIVLGDLVAQKSSLRVQPRATLTVGPASNGYREARLDIYIEHTGTNDELPFYAGFQRWWVEVFLPAGAERIWTHDRPQPDPAAPNGGSYLIELFPGWTGYVSVTFRFPDTQELLIRRQPGIAPLEFTLRQGDCSAALVQPVLADVTLPLGGACAGAAR